METLQNYDQFCDLYKSVKQRNGKLINNCPFMRKSVEDALNRGHVIFMLNEHGLLLFDDGYVRGVFRLLYFLDSERSLGSIQFDLPTLVEIMGKEELIDSSIEDAIEKGGFIKVATNCHMQYLFEPHAKEKDYLFKPLEYSNDFAFATSFSKEQKKEIEKLWMNNLKTTDVPKSHYDDIWNDKRNIVCLLDEKRQVCGVTWWNINGKVCEIRHTVTREKNRKQGVAHNLIRYVLEKAKEADCVSVITFIDENNCRSISLYESLGFQYTGKYTNQYCNVQ